jgi:hypothetical protein
MPRSPHKYHYIYKTTNLKNGKFYIGMHSTNNLDDGYLGSGNRLRRAIRKYGKANFKLEILEFFKSRNELASREKDLVNEDLLKDPLCMNLKIGGNGGFTKEQVYAGLKSANENRLVLLKENTEFKTKFSKAVKNGLKIVREAGKKCGFQDANNRYDWTGKKHSIKTIEKMKTTAKEKQLGKKEKNSQYGTQWITNGKINKKIKKEHIIPEGWRIGRIYGV